MYFGDEHVNRSVPMGKSPRGAHLVTSTLQEYVLQLGKNNGASLYEKALWREPWGWGVAPSLGILEDILRKAPDTSISLHRGPFTTEGTWNLEGGSYTGDFER
jgi:hypothetical protein